MKKLVSIFLINIISFFLILPSLANENVEQNNYLQIERKTIKLNSRLSTIYNGYEYKIKNIYDSPVSIEDITIWYNANGNVAFASVEKSKSQKISEITNITKKLSIPTFGISFIALPFVLPFSICKNNIENKAAKKEAEKFDILKTNKKFNIKNNQTTTIKTLALKNYTPILKVLYKNPITDEIGTLDLK